MKTKHLMLIWIGLALTWQALAQEAKLAIYGERSMDAVKLAWIPEVWPKNMDGVIIKKRIPGSNWSSLNTVPFAPFISMKRDLYETEPAPAERTRLVDKLKGLISSGRAREINQDDFYTEVLSKNSAQSSITLQFAMDYDMMLLTGTGCIDRDAVDEVMEYGVFPVVNGKEVGDPVAVTKIVQFKNNPTLEMTPSFEVQANRKQVRLFWEFDLTFFRDFLFQGFNIYAVAENGQQAKVNKRPIWITSKENPAKLTYLVDLPGQITTYTAVPLTIFGTETLGKSLEFDPAAATKVISAPILTTNTVQGNLLLRWELDHSLDEYIEVIEVHRKPVGAEYSLVKLLASSAREFIFPVSDTGEQSRFRIILQQKGAGQIWSNEKAVNILPSTKVPAPENLKAEIVEDNSTYFVELKWDFPGDASTRTFRVFTEGSQGDLIYKSSLQGEIKSPYRIEIINRIGRKERYAIQAMATDRTKSRLSNEVEVITPTISLPPIQFVKQEQTNGGVKLDWKFSEKVPDLQGFRLTIDGEPMLDTDDLNREKRSVILQDLTPGVHKAIIVAVTTFGIEKDSYVPYRFVVE